LNLSWFCKNGTGRTREPMFSATLDVASAAYHGRGDQFLAEDTDCGHWSTMSIHQLVAPSVIVASTRSV
jgi:hypothetical protein